MHREHLEIRIDELLEHRDRFGRWLAIAIVLTTLAGASVAYLEAGAVFEHDEAAVRAEQWATLSSAQRSRDEQAAELQIARRGLVRQHRVRGEFAEAQRLFGVGGRSLALTLESRGWRDLASRVHENSNRIAAGTTRQFKEIQRRTAPAFPDIDQTKDRTTSCDTDRRQMNEAAGRSVRMANADEEPEVAERYIASRRREAYRLDALRDGASKTAETAEKQFTRYAVSLALFAVAVFLFGYALTPYGRRYRRLYAFVACSLAAGSALWAVSAYIRGPERPPAEAAAAYADGRVALDSGYYARAIRHFSCAIQLDDEFALAYAERGTAYSLLGSPQVGTAIINEGLTHPAALQHALDDEQRAHELHFDDPTLVTSLAADLYVRGVANRNRGDIEKALEFDEEAAEALPVDPIPAFNAGTTLMALGRAWREKYEEAERLMMQKPDPQQYVSAALTDLEFLASSNLRAGLASEARAAKEHVVEAGTSGEGSSGGADAEVPFASIPARSTGPPAFSGVDLAVTPAAVKFAFSARSGFTPSTDKLFAAWYRRTDKGWFALPALSQPITGLQRDGVGRYVYVSGPAYPSPCLRSGIYKLELYVNGRLATSDRASSASVRLPRLRRASLTDLNVDLCRPQGWRRAPRRVVGVADGFVSPDRTAGILVFDITAGGPSTRNIRNAATIVLERFAPLLPRGAKSLGRFRARYFMGLSDGAVAASTYMRGRLMVGIGTTTTTRQLLAVVFGPTRTAVRQARAGISSRDLFDSLTSRDY